MKSVLLAVFLTIGISWPVVALDVRVLLADYVVSESPVFQLQSAGGFIVSRVNEADVYEIEKDTVSITFAKGRLVLDGRPLAVSRFLVRPKDEGAGIAFGERVYDGAFVVSLWNNKLFVVNTLDLESYLYSVLRWEGWPTWHEEANRAFAIVCRTYATHKVFLARRRKKPTAFGTLFDIKASNAHQTYGGRHTQRHWRRVVDETAGMVLVYHDEPIAAMYDMSCGGITPSALTGVDFAKYPYLKRSYPCLACRKWPYFEWKKEFLISDFESQLSIRLRAGLPDARIFFAVHDDAGVLRELSIKTRRGAHMVSGKKFYSLFKKEVKSLCCSIEKKSKTVLVRGKGYGHLLGYCQWGAAYMAKEQGMKYRELLSFFYPEAELKVLKKRDVTSAGI